MEEIAKYDKNGNIIEVTGNDREDILKWESIAQEAVKDAIRDLHEKGIPTVHADKEGIYETDGVNRKNKTKPERPI